MRACDPCRLAKRRCNGETPCDRCAARDDQESCSRRSQSKRSHADANEHGFHYVLAGAEMLPSATKSAGSPVTSEDDRMSNSSKDDGSSGTRTIEDVPVRNAMVLSLLMAHHIPAMLTEKPHLLASGLGITLRGTWFLMQVARVQAGPQELLRSLRMSTCVAAECDGSVPLMGDNAVWMIGRHACDFVAPSPSRLASRWGKAVAVATTRQARVRRFHVDRSTVLLNELGLPIHMNCTVYICLNEKANPLWVFVVVDSACPSTELVDPAVIGVPIPPRPDAVPLSHLM